MSDVRRSLPVLLTIGLMTVWGFGAPAASAKTSISGAKTPTGGSITAHHTTTRRATPVRSTPPCRNELVDPEELFPWPYEPPFEGGVYVRHSCYGEDLGWRWHLNVPPGFTYTESRSLELPRVTARMAPDPAGDVIVGVPVHLWLDDPQWEVQEKQMWIDGTRVDLQAVPIAVEWDMGDGTLVACNGPGVPFDVNRPVADQPPACTHTYQRSSVRDAELGRLRVVARSVWRLSWWASNSAAPTDLGDVVLEQPFSVRVVEAQAVLTRRPPESER